jgi:cytochrome c-type biogenesis protein CcmH/NrfG
MIFLETANDSRRKSSSLQWEAIMASVSDNRTQQNWTSTQAYLMAVICLIVGSAVGYLVRGSRSATPTTTAPAAVAATAQPPTDAMHAGTGANQMPSPEQLKAMADQQAAPLLAKLKQNPNDAETLAQTGNLYYDAHQFNAATDYYNRALKVDPKNAAVRTDLGTAYLYLNDPDRAIQEFQAALKDNPKHGQAMFNLGMAQWRAKGDAPGAVATWEKLLKTVPDFPERANVEQMIVQAKKHLNLKPGQKSEKPAA